MYLCPTMQVYELLQGAGAEILHPLVTQNSSLMSILTSQNVLQATNISVVTLETIGTFCESNSSHVFYFFIIFLVV